MDAVQAPGRKVRPLTFIIVPSPYRRYWTEYMSSLLERDLLQLFQMIDLGILSDKQLLVKATGQHLGRDMCGEGVQVGPAKAFMVEIYARYEGNPWDIWEITLQEKDTQNLRDQLLKISEEGIGFSPVTIKAEAFVSVPRLSEQSHRTIKHKEADRNFEYYIPTDSKSTPVSQGPVKKSVQSADPTVEKKDAVVQPVPEKWVPVKSSSPVMEDLSGVADTLALILRKADTAKEIMRKDLTEIFVRRHDNPRLHKTFVNQGFLQRLRGDKYRILRTVESFIEDYGSGSKSDK